MSADVLDSHGFTDYLEDLAKLSGKDFENVCLDQTAALLRICIRRTRAAKVGTIVKKVSAHNSHIVFEDGHVVSVWKKANHAEMFLDDSNYHDPGPNTRRQTRPPTLVKGKSWHEMNSPDRHWSDLRWGRYQYYLSEAKRRRIDLAAAKASRGVSKASWLQIADDLGLAMPDVPGYVRSAAPSNGKLYKNGLASRHLEAAAFFIEISNNHPIVVGKLNGAQILQGALDTRLKAFGYEMRTGVFKDLATRAQRYPGLFIN